MNRDLGVFRFGEVAFAEEFAVKVESQWPLGAECELAAGFEFDARVLGGESSEADAGEVAEDIAAAEVFGGEDV